MFQLLIEMRKFWIEIRKIMSGLTQFYTKMYLTLKIQALVGKKKKIKEMHNIRVMLSAASMFGGAGLSPKRNAFLQFEEFEDCGQYEW